jgi:hypothetical protein
LELSKDREIAAGAVVSGAERPRNPLFPNKIELEDGLGDEADAQGLIGQCARRIRDIGPRYAGEARCLWHQILYCSQELIRGE